MAIEQIRTALIIALCVVSFLIWDAWQRDYGPKPPPPPSTDQPASDAAPSDAMSPSVDVPQAPPSAQAEATAAAAPSPVVDPGDSASGGKIRVTTDVLDVEIDTRGGTIGRVALRSYPITNDKPDEPFVLLDDADSKSFFIAQSGLTGPRSAPNHHAQFEADAASYELADGMDVIEVPLRWRSDDGVEVTRTYRFARDHYVVDVEVDVANRSDEAWSGALYGQLQRGEPESSRRTVSDLHLHRRDSLGAREALREGRLLGHGEPGRRPPGHRWLGRDDPALLRRSLGPRRRRQ